MTQTAFIEPAFALSFLAGVASFMSPCVFPLVPGYLSALTFKDGKPEIGRGGLSLIAPVVLFVAGFSFVFSLMGTSVSFLGSVMAENRAILSTVSGSLIMVFGLFTMEVVKIPFLLKEKSVRIRTKSGGLAYVFALGCAFAVGWTPCIGPMLASILSYAASSGDAVKGVSLLLVYSAGLGTPFVLAGVFFTRWSAFASFTRRYRPVYKYVAGGLMVAVGFLMSVDLLFYVNIYGQRLFDLLGIDLWMRI